MRTIAITNLKGGSAKTTTAVNLAAALAEKGKRVLIIDLDPQAHATLTLGYDPETLDKTVYHCLVNGLISIPTVTKSTNIERLNLAPSNILLANVEFESAIAVSRGYVLADQLEKTGGEYDVCVIDCPPSLGVLTLNALVAATDVVVPVQMQFYALESTRRLLETVEVIKERFPDRRIRTLGLLLTLAENRTPLSHEIEQEMREFFGDLVFQTVIRWSISLAEAPSVGESIFSYAPESTGAADYRALAEELCDAESQKKHRLTTAGPILSPSDAAQPIKSKAVGGLKTFIRFLSQIFRPKSIKSKVALFLGFAILVAIAGSRIAAIMVNRPPVANHTSVTTQEDTPVSIMLTASDPDGDELIYTVLENPSHGGLTGTPPTLVYTPGLDYNGPDSFAFIVNDSAVDSDPAVVSITVKAVNDAPIAQPQSVKTKINRAAHIALTANDIDGDPLTFIICTQADHGKITRDPGFNGNGKFICTPDPGYIGTDSFTFMVSDGAVKSNPATVSITVSENQAPTAEPQAVTTTEDASVPITLMGKDRDGDPLTYAVVMGPAKGSLGGTAPELRYTPTANFNGTDQFTFTVNDGMADSEPATVSITVTSVNDPPVAKGDHVTIQEDEPVTIDVLRLCSDVDHDSLTVAVVTQGDHGSVSINEDSTLTYTPNANFCDTDAFTYTVSDGSDETDTAKVTVTVMAVNDPPKITSTPQDRAVPGVPYTYQVEAVDLDRQDSLTYFLITGPTGMSINPRCGLVGWNPSTAQIGNHDVIVKVADNSSDQASDTQSFTIMVESVQPHRTILIVTDAYDEKTQRTLSTENKTYVVQSSDGECWGTDSGSYTSYDFSDQSIPAGSTITLVEIWVQHFEEEQFPLGKLQWSIGTGWPSNPVVWVSLNTHVRAGKDNKATEAWNVTSLVDTPEKVNSLELQVKNNSAIAQGKTLVDYIHAVVEWY
jgi:VCBS repeat-containing protein